MESTLNTIDSAAAQVAQSQESFQTEIRGHLDRALTLMESKPFSISTAEFRAGLNRSILNLGHSQSIFTDHAAVQLIQLSKRAVEEDASTQINLGSAQELVKTSLSNLRTLLDQQAQRDGMTAERFLSATLLAANQMKRERNWQQHSAIITARHRGEVDFTYIDRINRRWSSNVYAQLTTRQAMLDIFNESYISMALDLGAEKFVLTHPEEPDMPFNLADYPSVREKSIHPRSNRLVKVDNK